MNLLILEQHLKPRIKPIWKRLGKIYTSYRAKYYLRHNQTPILVYQMGKVGSMSVYESLKRSHIQRPLHLHGVKPEQAALLRQKEKVKIITLVREPIGRNIAAFFQTFKKVVGVRYEDADFSYENLQGLFLERYDHTKPLTWFDRRIKKPFDIDIYHYPFPRETGVQVITAKNLEILILKLEIGDQALEGAIARFLELDRFKLIRANVAANKNYAETYRVFKQVVRLPLEYIETMCSAKYTRHFYTQAEIQAMRARWQRHPEQKTS